jgi:hypothetical protein
MPLVGDLGTDQLDLISLLASERGLLQVMAVTYDDGKADRRARHGDCILREA